MRWSAKQRMAFISDRLGVVGKINRRDIMEHFEVSEPQASADFRTFEREHPGAMRYDSHAKAYVSTMNDGAPMENEIDRIIAQKDREPKMMPMTAEDHARARSILGVDQSPSVRGALKAWMRTHGATDWDCKCNLCVKSRAALSSSSAA